MLERLLKAAKQPHEIVHATRLARFYVALTYCGLKLHHGRFSSYRFEKKKGENGGYVRFCIGDDLYLDLGVYGVRDQTLECEVHTMQTKDLLSLHNVGKGWKLFYSPDDEEPDPDIRDLARPYRFGKKRSEVELDALQVRGFLRAVAILTDEVYEDPMPAHP